MCILIFNTFILNSFHSKKTEGDMIKKIYIVVHVKYLLLSHFSETWIFSSDFRKKKTFKYQISWKTRLVGAESFHADGETDRHTRRSEQSLFLYNSAKAPKR